MHNACGNKGAGENAQNLMPLMEQPELFSDLAFVHSFHEAYFKKNLDWFMQSADLTKPGFQSHQTAVRYHIMTRRLEDLSAKALTTDSSFLNFRKSLKISGENGKPINEQLQIDKCEGFIKDSQYSVRKHFRRCADRHHIPAALMAELPFAQAIARIIRGLPPDLEADKAYENGKFYSKVHKEYVSICEFEADMTACFLEELARDGHTFDEENPYDATKFFEPQVLDAAKRISTSCLSYTVCRSGNQVAA